MIKRVVWGLFIFSSVAFGSELAQHRDWLNLLYYEKTGSGYESVADGNAFFLTPEGKTSPNAEYQAALTLTRSQNADFKSRFPLRYKWMARQHHLPYTPSAKINSNIVSMTIAFPNRYMHNPSSMFGHVILILNSKNGLMDSDIFHYLADTGRTNPKYYLLYGMTGGFDGRFLTEPYFRKIKDYTYVEDRDIIYYDLNLNAEQLENFQLHTIELQQTHFNYYFIDQNCAYFIGKALNVILDHDIIHSPFIAAPSEVIRELYQRGDLVREYHRNSISGQFTRRYQALSHSEKQDVFQWLTTEQQPPTPSTNTEVLATFLTVSEHILNNATDLTQIIRHNRVEAYRVLQAQHHPPIRPAFAYQPKVMPVSSQGLHIGYGLRDQYFLSYRRIHYGDQPSSSPFEDKTLTALAPRLTFSDRNAMQVDVTLADIVSIAPYTKVLQTSSWKVNSQLGIRQEGVIHHQAIEFGRAIPMSENSYFLGFVGSTFSNYNPIVEQPIASAQLSLALSAGFTKTFTPRLKARVDYSHRYREDYVTAQLNVKTGRLSHAVSALKSTDFTGLRASSTFEF